MSTDANQRSAIVAATLTSFLTPFMGSAVNIALRQIGDEFAMDAVSLSWVATAFSLAAAVFLVPFGKLADIYGRKKIFGLGTIIFTVAVLLGGLATSPQLLITWRVMQGIGSAMIFGTGVAILTSVCPPSERGKALGLNVAAVYLGLSLGPTIGGVLTQQFGWRSVFLATVLLGVIAAGYIAWGLKGEWAEARGERFDLTGSLIYSAGLVALMLGLTRLPGKEGAVLLLAGLVGLAIFAGWEIRTAQPVLDMRLFTHNKVFAFSNLAALINYSATAAVGFMLSLYLQYVQGLTPQQAGLVLLAQPVLMAIVSPLAGWLSDRVEPRVVASAGMALSAAGLFLLVLIGEHTPLVSIAISLGVLGLGFGLFSSPNTNAIMGSVERRLYGVASGSLGTMRLVGQMLSMGAASLILAVFVGRVQITPDVFDGFMTAFRTAFAIFATLCVGGVFASLIRGTVHAQNERARP